MKLKIKKIENRVLNKLIQELLKQKIKTWETYFEHDFCKKNIYLLNSVNSNG